MNGTTVTAGGAWKPAVLDAFGYLQVGRLYVAVKAPYYRTGVMRLVPEVMEGLGTVGVTAKGRLYYDPAKVLEWGLRPNGAGIMGATMAHELLHVLLNHDGRRAKLGLHSPEQRARWNEAGDLAINVILVAGGWDLSDANEWLLPKQYSFPEDCTAEQYYQLLLDHEAKQKAQAPAPAPGGAKKAPEGAGAPNGPSPGPGAPGGAPGAPGGGPEEKPHAGKGWCGSCAGRPLPGEPPADAPPQPGDATEADLERVRRAVAAEVRKAAARNPGTVPGELSRWADEMLQPPKVRWQQKLQRAVRSGIAVRSGVQDYTRTRPARRQFGIGVGIGRPLVAAMITRTPRVAFVQDTSGSVGNGEIRAAAAEVAGILRTLGYPIEFMSCDAKVHRVKRVAKIQDLVDAIVGGGGTDFRPVFKQLEEERFQGVLVFSTDGHGPAPVEPPRGIHVIWLLVGKGTKAPATWGEVIEVEADDTAAD